MISYLGDFAEDTTVYIMFNTFTSNDPSASCTITNFAAGDVHIHKDDGLTQRNNAAGITVSVDFDGITGSHMVKIDTSDNTVAGFWVVGHEYFVRIEGTTIDGATINSVVGQFSIENRFNEVDVVKWLGTAAATPTVAGVPETDITHIGGVAQSATDLKDMVDTGYDPSTHKIQSDLIYIHGSALTETAGQLAAAFTKLFDVASPLLVASEVMRGTDSAYTGTPPTVAAIVNEWETQSQADPTGFHVNVKEVNGTAQTANDNGADINAILIDTAVIGALGAGLTAIPWNSSWDAEVESEVTDALIALNLDHLMKTATGSADMTLEVVDNTVLSRILANGDTSIFVPSTDGFQPIRDQGDSAWITAAGFSTHSAADIWTVVTRALTDKSGFALSSTGADLILKNSTFALAIADAIADEELTGATHNVVNSLGRRVREIGAFAIHSGTAQAGASNSITLAATADSNDGIYNRNLIVLVDNTGAGQTRTIVDYDGSTKIAVIDRDFRVSPDATTTYQITPADTALVVDQGIAQAGTSTTITLRSYASAVNDTYLCNIVVIIAGTGRGQARLVGSYVGSTKVVTICGDNWVTTPDATSAYVMMPYGTGCTSCLGTYALSQINAEIGMAKNVALPKFDFYMVLSSDHVSAATGKTVTGKISKDGGAFASITNAITEVSDGMYKIASGFTQTEMNADVITLKFTATNCDQRIITIYTT